jgi:hypothetical protein
VPLLRNVFNKYLLFVNNFFYELSSFKNYRMIKYHVCVCVCTMKKQIMLLTTLLAAFSVTGVVLLMAPQAAFAGSASSTGAATDDGSACSGASGSATFGDSSSSSAAGRSCDASAGAGFSAASARR